MRLSLQKAAHANLANAAYKKPRSHQRTWEEKDGAQPLPKILPLLHGLNSGETWSESI
jgi:hypothetical protein